VILKFEYSLLFPKDVPSPGGAILLGRSNVGKSSLINALGHNSGRVAKTSKRPGKTQTINFFSFHLGSRQFFLIDTPGYGFAKVAKRLQQQWKTSMNALLKISVNYLIIAIQDARNPWQEGDKMLYDYVASFGHPIFLLFNKMDKLNQREFYQLKSKHKHAIFASAITGEGIDLLIRSIEKFCNDPL
jgi:GTP-binding protein